MKEGPYGARKPHEPSRMRMWGSVSVDDVLQALVGKGPRIESSTGTQLEIAQQNSLTRPEKKRSPRLALVLDAEGYSRETMTVKETLDSWRAMDDAELAIGRELGVTRCLDDLAKVEHAYCLKNRATLFYMHQVSGRGDGDLVIGCLRAYHEWESYSKERALASVYAWAQGVLEKSVPDACELAQQFREGKASAQRKRAASLYADALLVLSAWVLRWDQKSQKGLASLRNI